MSITDDLSVLFGAEGNGMTMRQGKVVSWNTSTGENRISLGGVTVENVPLLVAESTVLVAGDSVAILSDGDQAFLLGKVTSPGEPGTVPTWSADITELNDVTIPAVQAESAAAQQAADDALARFPIAATDIQDGAISTPKLAANAIDGITITGSLFRTAATGQRWEIGSTPDNTIEAFSGQANEAAPGGLEVTGATNYGDVVMKAPTIATLGNPAFVQVTGETVPSIYARADVIDLYQVNGSRGVRLSAGVLTRLDASGWVAPTLLNSWVNFGGTSPTVQYYKYPDGDVALRGVAKSGTAVTIFTLPAGYRPPLGVSWIVPISGGSARLIVESGGNVTVPVPGGATTFVEITGRFSTLT